MEANAAERHLVSQTCMHLRLGVSAAAVESALTRYFDDPAPDAADTIAVARRLHALPLFSEFMGCWALRPTGEVIFFPWEEPNVVEPVEVVPRNALGVHVARAHASRRFPEIAGLAPPRPPDAIPCSSCNGDGRTKHHNIVCSCGGLGWRPPEFLAPAG